MFERNDGNQEQNRAQFLAKFILSIAIKRDPNNLHQEVEWSYEIFENRRPNPRHGTQRCR